MMNEFANNSDLLQILRLLPFATELGLVVGISVLVRKRLKYSAKFFSRYWRALLTSILMSPLVVALVVVVTLGIALVGVTDGKSAVQFALGTIGRLVLVWPFIIAWKVFGPLEVDPISAERNDDTPQYVSEPQRVRLGGWQRVGIVSSCFWVAVVFLWTGYERIGYFPSCEHTTFTYLQNPDMKPGPDSNGLDWSTAVMKGQKNCPPADMKRRVRTLRVLAIAVVPVAVMWILFWVGNVSVRWVRAGFKAE